MRGRPDSVFLRQIEGAGTSNPLNKVNGQLILLNGRTVHGDAASDTLTGTNLVNPQTGKRAYNWFLVDSFDALVNFDSGNDRKTKVKQHDRLNFDYSRLRRARSAAENHWADANAPPNLLGNSKKLVGQLWSNVK